MLRQQIEPTNEAVARETPAVLDPVMTVARSGGTTAKRGAGRIAAHLPGAVQATRAAAGKVSSALQAMPDRTLRSLAASSVGLGAGLHIRGAPRVMVVAAVMPAVVMGATVALRPPEPVASSGTVE